MASLTYLMVLAAVVAVLTGGAESRPQTPDASEVEEVAGGGQQEAGAGVGVDAIPPGRFGAVVGEVFAYTDTLTVSKLNKKKKQERQEEGGPSASALVAGPAEASVGLSAGVSLVPTQAKVELVSAR